MEEEERNYCCLALLLLRVGNPCLRRYFKNQWNAAVKYTPWTDCAQNGADLLRMFKPLPYEKDAVKSGDTSQWDMSLLVKALLHSRPPFVVAADPVAAALETLRKMRNNLCHSPIPRVEATDFQTSWRDGCNALSLFGATAGDFDKVEQDVQKPWSELLPMLKHCSDQDQAILDTLDSLRQGQDNIAEGQAKLLQGQDDIAEGQAQLLQGQDTILEDLSSIKQDQRKILESHAKGDRPAEKDLSSRALEYTEKLKSSIKQQTDFLLSEEEDKKIRTDDIFTSVTIQRGPKHLKEPKEGIFGRRQSDEVQANCSEMFVCPENDVQKSTAPCTTNPKSILLTGKAGIGKSLFLSEAGTGLVA